MRALAVLIAALALTGCVSVDVDASLTCRGGLNPATTVELVFGRNIGDAPGVTDADWKAFLDQEVTPRFPDGLTVSDAFRMMLTRVAREKALPFEPLVPNAKTVAAMKEARRGKLQKFATIDDLMADLHADD